MATEPAGFIELESNFVSGAQEAGAIGLLFLALVFLLTASYWPGWRRWGSGLLVLLLTPTGLLLLQESRSAGAPPVESYNARLPADLSLTSEEWRAVEELAPEESLLLEEGVVFHRPSPDSVITYYRLSAPTVAPPEEAP